MAANRRALLEKGQREARRQDALRQHFHKTLKEDTSIRTQVESDKRVSSLRRSREEKSHQKEQEERLKQERIKQTMEEEMRVREQEIRQMKEMEATVKATESKERLRQAIRESSWELRELESKLKNAYAVKECLAQIKENEVKKQLEKGVETKIAEELNEKLAIAQQEEEVKEVVKMQKRLQYREDLHEQLEASEKRKKEEYQRFLEEKKMVDEVVRKIMEDDEREAHIRFEQATETKQFIQKFIKEREQWKIQEKARIAEENRKIAEFARQQSEREETRKEAKRQADAARDAIYDKLSSDMAHKEKARLELEDLRVDLYAQEQDERLAANEKAKIEKRIRQRLELVEAFQQQAQDKSQRLEKEKDDEEKFRAKMIQKYAEESRLEQLSDQKKRMKQLEHRHAVENLIQERRRRVEEESKLATETFKEQGALAEFRREVIEQERQKLLREHAAHLVGFLPKGLLRDKKDLELFDQDFRERFATKRDLIGEELAKYE